MYWWSWCCMLTLLWWAFNVSLSPSLDGWPSVRNLVCIYQKGRNCFANDVDCRRKFFLLCHQGFHIFTAPHKRAMYLSIWSLKHISFYSGIHVCLEIRLQSVQILWALSRWFPYYRPYGVEWYDKWTTNLKGFGRERPWPNWDNIPGFTQWDWINPRKTWTQDSQCRSRIRPQNFLYTRLQGCRKTSLHQPYCITAFSVERSE